jgi:hypothetical protein
MPNSFQNLTTGLAELKNVYEGPIVDQFNQDLPILRAAEKVKKAYSGLQVVRPWRVRRNQGVGAASDGGNLPAIGNQVTVQATVAAKYNYLRFGITGPMIKASQSDVGSFVRSAAYELEQGYNDLKADVNRQLTWDGTNTLALANAATVASTSLVVKSRTGSEPALKFLDVGVVIDIYTSAGVQVASGVQVTAVSGTPTATTATLTLSNAITCSANDLVIRSGTYGNEIQGILYSMDGGTSSSIYGVSRSTYPIIQSNYSSTVQQLTIDYLQQYYNEGMRRGGAKYSSIYSDFDALRYYQKLLTADKRYVNTTKGDGGFSNKDQTYLEFNGVPWVTDKDCPPTILGLQASSWKNYVLCEMEFADETGTMYIAQTGTDALEVRIRYFANLFNEQPNAQFRLVGYTSP